MFWFILAAMLLGAVLLLGVYLLLGVTGLTLLFALVAIATVTWLWYRSFFIVLNEMEIGVVFSKRNGNFSRFIVTPDPDPNNPNVQNNRRQRMGRYFPPADPYHYHLGFGERLEGIISKGAQRASGTCEQLRTKEGIPLSIDWTVSYTIDVSKIKPDLRHKMARALPESSSKIVTGRMVHVLQHVIEQKPISELYKESALKKLEEEVSLALTEKLQLRDFNQEREEDEQLAAEHAEAKKQGAIQKLERLQAREERLVADREQGLGFNEVKARDVRLGPIRMPPQVEKALEIAHQRELQTETIKKLREAICRFSEADMQKLAELERLRIIEENGNSLVYLMDSLGGVKDNPFPDRKLPPNPPLE